MRCFLQNRYVKRKKYFWKMDIIQPSNISSKINIYTKGTFSSKRILPHFPLCPQLPHQLIIIRCAGNLPPSADPWRSSSSFSLNKLVWSWNSFLPGADLWSSSTSTSSIYFTQKTWCIVTEIVIMLMSVHVQHERQVSPWPDFSEYCEKSKSNMKMI